MNSFSSYRYVKDVYHQQDVNNVKGKKVFQGIKVCKGFVDQMVYPGTWVLKDHLGPRERKECLVTLVSWAKKAIVVTWVCKDLEAPQEFQ